MTIRQLAEEQDIKPTSLQKSIRRWKSNNAKAEIFNRAGISPEDAPTGLDDRLPSQLADSIRQEYNNTPAPPPKKKAAKKTKTQKKPTAPAERQKSSNAAAAVFAWILIAADATSCAWIANNTYQGAFKTPATAIFAGVGFAIGYSAFRNISQYKGYNGDSYAWGFGFFQALIHLCAMQSFDYFAEGISFGIGKVVIAIALPIATSGLAVTFKNKDA